MEQLRLEKLEQQLLSAQKELAKRKGIRDRIVEQKNEVEAKWQQLNKERDLLEKVQILLQKSSDHAREQAKMQLETLVTKALQYVFGPMFRFEIELSDHGGNPTAEFYVITEWNGKPIRNKPQDSRGGGVVDIISLALRIALLETIRPRLQGPIMLDEPGKHVSEDFVVPMIEFLKSICETFGRQVIMVTHNTHLTEAADQAFFVRLSSGKSVVNREPRLDNRRI
ncbi:ATP-binding protein [Thermoflavimicrobium daqui]|jgi:DNA repair exonuclease SbcCD ATPase subunit|uniref:ATPase n=1 Tax=Thermoflavimicrobium daqui TaxID=2137476 RepID=A0A364K7X4_9BACL|nr:ATP-binding protein [Thermoflavimicrobium daqui]RAL26401.1 ATPase [Thermoflavimicrobium daqui]